MWTHYASHLTCYTIQQLSSLTDLSVVLQFISLTVTLWARCINTLFFYWYFECWLYLSSLPSTMLHVVSYTLLCSSLFLILSYPLYGPTSPSGVSFVKVGFSFLATVALAIALGVSRDNLNCHWHYINKTEKTRVICSNMSTWVNGSNWNNGCRALRSF